jgi:hypothetical protein
MTEADFRSIELSIDQALRIFEHTAHALSDYERATLEKLKAIQAEMHTLHPRHSAKGKT